jgi:uncharacterized protein YqgQ
LRQLLFYLELLKTFGEGIFTKEEFLEMVGVVNREMKREGKVK